MWLILAPCRLGRAGHAIPCGATQHNTTRRGARRKKKTNFWNQDIVIHPLLPQLVLKDEACSSTITMQKAQPWISIKSIPNPTELHTCAKGISKRSTQYYHSALKLDSRWYRYTLQQCMYSPKVYIYIYISPPIFADRQLHVKQDVWADKRKECVGTRAGGRWLLHHLSIYVCVVLQIVYTYIVYTLSPISKIRFSPKSDCARYLPHPIAHLHLYWFILLTTLGNALVVYFNAGKKVVQS